MPRELPLPLRLPSSGVTHEVQVLCSCDDIEQCRMELYVSDVRILKAELEEALRSSMAVVDSKVLNGPTGSR
jgi:hypothetical protein